MQRLIGFGLAAISAWLLCVTPAFAELRVSASAVALSVGATTTVKATGASGSVSVASMDPRIATAKYASGLVTIRAVAAGKTKINVKDREHTVTIAVTVSGSRFDATAPVSNSVPWRVLASNDLGMHCADLDYQVFSILPPFNVVHAQVVLPGTATTKPKLLTSADADVAYRATSSLVDPVAAGSINTTSGASSIGAKTNFWDPATLPNGVLGTLGALAYRLLYPNAVLDAFAPIPADTGIPVPDPAQLPQLAAGQQKMPSPSNVPQKFNRFDTSLPFFKNFPFGTTVANANWFSADGIPIVPVDDAGRSNPYPLMRVQAVAKGANPATASNIRGSVDIVLPVASEADCKNCHNGTRRHRRSVRLGDQVQERPDVADRTGNDGARPRQGEQRCQDQHPAVARRQVGLQVHDRGQRDCGMRVGQRELVPRQATGDPVLAMPLFAGARPRAGRADRRTGGRRQWPAADAARIHVARDARHPRPVHQPVPGDASARQRPHAAGCRQTSCSRPATSVTQASRPSACAARWAPVAPFARTATAA